MKEESSKEQGRAEPTKRFGARRNWMRPIRVVKPR